MVFVEEIITDEEQPRKRNCVTRSMTASLNERKMTLFENNATKLHIKRDRMKRARCNSNNSKKKSKVKKRKICNNNNEPEIELSNLTRNEFTSCPLKYNGVELIPFSELFVFKYF